MLTSTEVNGEFHNKLTLALYMPPHTAANFAATRHVCMESLYVIVMLSLPR